MCISNSQAVRLLIWLKHLYSKYNLGHVILLLSYGIYIVTCGYLFYLAESTNSVKVRKTWEYQIAHERNKFIRKEILPSIFNNTKLFLYIHDQKSQHLALILNNRLMAYERVIKLESPMPQVKYDLKNSIIFAFSTITTIGYSHIYPVTENGKILSIIISIFGIPFTMVIIKDLSYLIAKLLILPCLLLERVWAVFRFCTIRPVDEYELERKLHSEGHTIKDYRLHDAERLLSIPVTIAIFSLLGWITFGCFMLRIHVPNLSYSTAFFFIFNSLTTTGSTAVDPQVLSIMLLYLLFGLTLVSLFVNLLHTKLCRAYWLPGKMYTPLRPLWRGQLASTETFQEITMDDSPFNHFTTLGVLHTDDKRELLGISRKEAGIVDAQTQTVEKEKECVPRTPSPTFVKLPASFKSKENVSDLIIETYGKPLGRVV